MRLALAAWLILALAQPASATSRADRAAALAHARAEARVSPQATDRYLGALEKEPDPHLRRYELTALLERGAAMTRAQKKAALAQVRQTLLPKRPPVPKQGTIEVRYYLGGDEFFFPAVQQLSNLGWKVTDAEGAGVEARRGRVRILIDNDGDRVLRDLSDPNVHAILYQGHSQLGATIERALEAQPRIGEDKLVALLTCKGTQTLPLLKAHAPGSHIITTDDYFYSGTDRGFAPALLEGLERGETYAQIRRRVPVRREKYVFPDQTRALAHFDLDEDGQVDRAKLAAGDAAFADLSKAARRGGARLVSALGFLRSLNPYRAEQGAGGPFDPTMAKARLVPAGIEYGDGKRVTHIRTRRDGGFDVSLDARWAEASPAFVGASVVYELQLHLQDALAGQRGASAERRALADARDYVTRMFPADEAESAIAALEARSAR